MYLMFVDESGDTGLTGSPTGCFVLSGLVIHESRWQDCLERLIRFRRRMRHAFGLKLREEIHSRHMITGRPGELVRIPKNDRLSIIRFHAREIAGLPDVRIINVVVDKTNKPQTYDVFELSLIHISEPTRRTPISYAVFCL